LLMWLEVQRVSAPEWRFNKVGCAVVDKGWLRNKCCSEATLWEARSKELRMGIRLSESVEHAHNETRVELV
jgi:hypothetical protein